MIDINTLPALPRENQRATVLVTDEATLNQIGVSAGQFSMHLNDEILFNLYQDNGNPIVKSQKLDNGQANYIACTRNGKPSWISAGSLARLDSDMNPVDDFGKGYRDLVRSKNFTTMFKEYLKDKTITALSEQQKTFNKFGESGTETRTVPVISFKA